MSSSELKSLALLAKQRLRDSNYQNNQNKNAYSNRNSYFIKNVSAMKKLSGRCEFVTITDVEDLQFLKKVYSILNSNEDVYNPIGRLVDKDYFDTLNETERQTYVFKIADRYNLAKEKYYASKSGS